MKEDWQVLFRLLAERKIELVIERRFPILIVAAEQSKKVN